MNSDLHICCGTFFVTIALVIFLFIVFRIKEKIYVVDLIYFFCF